MNMKKFIHKHFCFIVSIVVSIFSYAYSFCFISDFVFDIHKLLTIIILCLLVGIVEYDGYRRGINGVLNYISNLLQEDNNIDETNN